MTTALQPSDTGYRPAMQVSTDEASRMGKASEIYMSEITTPLGTMLAGTTARGVCLLEFTNRIRLEKEFSDLQKMLNAVMLSGRNQYSDQLEKELNEYFAGKRKTFSVPLNMPGNEFSLSVWKTLLDIPYGKTCSYKEQAESMNNPKAIRAIAATNGRNRLAIIVPCHRVIGSDGSMTGYAAGVETKKWLLNFERNNSETAPGYLF
jgi:AraC family transcriptional regulator, regulatory protein of adaptative response / methylated-DNA-[protein]-cysteine methyltransferase